MIFEKRFLVMTMGNYNLGIITGKAKFNFASK